MNSSIGSTKNSLILFGFMAVFFVAIYFMAKGVFTILNWIFPVLIILTLIINYRVFIDFGKTIINQYKKSFLSGLTWTVLSVFGYPFVAAYLFLKAIAYKKIEALRGQHKKTNVDDFVDYEIVEEEEEELELKKIPKQYAPGQNGNSYDELFK